jgi:hypothetical protein
VKEHGCQADRGQRAGEHRPARAGGDRLLRQPQQTADGDAAGQPEKNKIDCAIGGGRRDEEKARAKERVFSHRDEFGQWDPKNQRPELWNIYNGRKRPGEHFRAFPISNWTEMDVWQYILLEKIPIPKHLLQP